MIESEERWVLRAAEQRALDERAGAEGIEQDALMESAGSNAARWIETRFRPSRPLVLAGPGGNGGDALVVARRLHEAGAKVRTLVLGARFRPSPATRRMIERLEEAGADPAHPASADELSEALESADCVVDGLFGCGLDRPLDEEAARAVERMNASRRRIVSLDLPSGLASDRGETLGPAVRADVTLAMAFLKPSHLLYPAAGYCGDTAVIDVAYPPAVLRAARPWARVCERAGIRRRLPSRRPDGHKGTFGRVLVVAGSVGMTGAALLCCRGALRAGAGLVELAGPASLQPIFAAALPEAITIPLPDADGHVRGLDDPRFREAAARADAVAIGPGLSRAPETLDAVRSLVETFDGPIVIDADATSAFAGHADALGRLAGRAVLTPHPGEFGSLVGLSPETVDRDRRDRARAFALEHGLVLVLKGRPTAIGLPDGEVYLNPTGHDGLATGGTGDVLTGLIAGFAAGGASPADAALVGTYVHGLAAERFAHCRAARSLLPSDLVDLLPEALWEVERCG